MIYIGHPQALIALVITALIIAGVVALVRRFQRFSNK
jgi:hypothetical protein